MYTVLDLGRRLGLGVGRRCCPVDKLLAVCWYVVGYVVTDVAMDAVKCVAGLSLSPLP